MGEIMKKYLYLIILIYYLTSLVHTGDTEPKNSLPFSVWDSFVSSAGSIEIWFQNWSDYTRLFIKSVTDTSLIEKHPYAKTDFKKSYLNARDYYKLNYLQLLGNINWLGSQDWSDGAVNEFEWEIDRDQNWNYINTKLTGSAKIQSGVLYLVIKDYKTTILEIESHPRKFK